MARPYMSIFPFSLLNFFFSLSLFISRLSPLIASLHELPQEITSTNISKMKQLKSGRKLFQGGIRSSFLLKVSLVGLKTQSYRQHLFFHPGYVRFKMCHTSKYTQTLGWHVLDMNRLTRWQLESQWCWDFTEVGDVGLSLMPLKIAASVSACQTILPKSRLPWQDLGAPHWEERRSNQEQTAKRLRREAGAFPPSPLASSTLIRGEWHVHGHPGNVTQSHNGRHVSVWGGAKNTSSGETCTRFFFFLLVCASPGYRAWSVSIFSPPMTLLATLPESCHR